MRTDKEMMDLILNVAKDERIRAVVINGSRTNTNAPKDIFQDYDIVYIVRDINSFINDNSWIDVFGERLIMQMPESMSMFSSEYKDRFHYLMQFVDGNRIDLTLLPISQSEIYIKEDKLTVVLLDKDNFLPLIQSPSDEDYWVKQPTAEFFDNCCNEFWWVCTYVAKGLWRNEILYAKAHMDNNIRPMLLKMLEWRVGIDTGFSVSIGKFGKYIEKYLPEDIWKLFISTYTNSSYENTWESLFTACDLFNSTSKYVASYFSYKYIYDKSITQYLKYVQNLPYVIHK